MSTETKTGTVTQPAGETVTAPAGTTSAAEPAKKAGRPTKAEAEAKKAAEQKAKGAAQTDPKQPGDTNPGAGKDNAPSAQKAAKKLADATGTEEDQKALETLADKILNSDENGRPLRIQCAKKNRICAPEYEVVRNEGEAPEHVCKDCVGAASSFYSCTPYYRGV